MSYGCMYILRTVKDVDELRRRLTFTANTPKCTIGFDPINNLLLEGSVKLGVQDLAFEVWDDMNSRVGALLLSHEGYMVNGEKAELPLVDRLRFLQEVAVACLPHADKIEIFLGEDTPYLPDYSVYKITCADIADVLYQEYQANECYFPCVHLIVEKTEKA